MSTNRRIDEENVLHINTCTNTYMEFSVTRKNKIVIENECNWRSDIQVKYSKAETYQILSIYGSR